MKNKIEIIIKWLFNLQYVWHTKKVNHFEKNCLLNYLNSWKFKPFFRITLKHTIVQIIVLQNTIMIFKMNFQQLIRCASTVTRNAGLTDKERVSRGPAMRGIFDYHIKISLWNYFDIYSWKIHYYYLDDSTLKTIRFADVKNMCARTQTDWFKKNFQLYLNEY